MYWREGNKPCKEATWSVLLEALEEGAERKSYAKRLRNALIRSASEHQPRTERETKTGTNLTYNTHGCTVKTRFPQEIATFIYNDNGHKGTISTYYAN